MVTTDEQGVTFDELCEVACALPGVEAGLSYGTPVLYGGYDTEDDLVEACVEHADALLQALGEGV